MGRKNPNASEWIERQQILIACYEVWAAPPLTASERNLSSLGSRQTETSTSTSTHRPRAPRHRGMLIDSSLEVMAEPLSTKTSRSSASTGGKDQTCSDCSRAR